MLEAFAVTLAGVIFAQASPGPNLFAVASVGLSQGRKHALCVVAGVSTGLLVWAVAFAAGLGALLTAYPLSLILLKLIGGSYLAYLGFRALKGAWHGQTTTIAASGDQLTPTAAWKRGLFVVLTNPKAALMWAAVASYLFGAGLTPTEVALFGPIAAVSAMLIYGAYGLLFSTGIATRTYQRFTRIFETLFGLLFGALGAGLAADGMKDLRP